MLKENTCAGIVLYNPNLDKLIANLDSLIGQVNKIICIDNASSNLSEIETVLLRYSTAELIINDKNMGIAYALNQIFQYSKENGYEWYLSMDQDSCCALNLINEYAIHMPDEKEVAVLCPYVLNNSKITFDEYKEYQFPEIQEITQPIDCITSGCLNNVEAVKKIRGYNSKLFIDCVDVDFNLRLMLLHRKIYRVNSTYMFQQMGEARKVKLINALFKISGKNVFRRLRYTPVYSDIRLYYISRNSKYIYKKYGKLAGKRMTPIWMKWQFLYYLFTYPVQRNRISMLKAIQKGYRDCKEV